MNSSISFTGPEAGAYRTGFVRWRAAENGFEGWTLNGVKRNTSGELEFDPLTASPGSDPYPAGSYNGGNYYNAGTFFAGEATSPEFRAAFAFRDAIASWNATIPAGSWLEVQLRARYGARWSKWYVLGIWASDDSTIRRHSVPSQGDSDGNVAVDTFVSTNKEETPDTFQLKFRLFSVEAISTPSLRNASLAYSTVPPKPAQVSAGNPALWNCCLDVPPYSQMIYPDGGSVWCSPTSAAMIVSYYSKYSGKPEPRVRSAVEGVYDRIYDGHGNWPFNTAYVATQGYEGYVARLNSLTEAEEYIAAGVPLIMSIAWNQGELTGADVESTNGHLLVLVGFDEAGNPIVNDPASPANATVRRTYLRSEFEPLWLQASGGTVYLIHPPEANVPALP